MASIRFRGGKWQARIFHLTWRLVAYLSGGLIMSFRVALSR